MTLKFNKGFSFLTVGVQHEISFLEHSSSATGLFQVDFKTKKRYARPSALVLNREWKEMPEHLHISLSRRKVRWCLTTQ